MKHSHLPRVLRRLIGLMRFTREAVGATAASVFLLDVERCSMRGLVSEWDWTRTSFPSSLADWPNVALALADGDVRAISAADARGGETGWFEERGIATTLCVPLRNGMTAYGVLFFDFAVPPAPLGRVERALLHDVARRCARALARARAVVPAEERLLH